MATRTPLILNQITARIEELAAGDTLPGSTIEGLIGRNRIINGDFRFAQRGESWADATNSVRFFADRWIAGSVGSLVSGGIVATPAGGGSAGPLLAGSRYFAQVNVTSVAGAANSAYFQQRIEDVRTFAGKTVTISFVAKASVADFKIGIEFSQNFGSGGSPTVNGISAPLTLSADWARHSLTISVPSILGKTLGANNFIQFTIWLDAGASSADRASNCGQKSGLAQFAELQIEEGGGATPFERRSDALELTLCQRYYEKSYNDTIVPGTATSTAGSGGASLRTAFLLTAPVQQFLVQKRATPALTSYAPQNGAAGQYSEYDAGSSFIANRACAVLNASVRNFEMVVTSGSGVVGNTARFHWTADAEL